MFLLIAGAVLGVAILGLVHQMSVFGTTCYYVGELNMQTTSCIAPVFYYAAIGVAALLAIIGIVRMVRPNTSAPSK